MSGLEELFADHDHDQPTDPAPKARPTTDASFAMQFADATTPSDIARANPGPMRRGQARRDPGAGSDTTPTAPLPRYGRHEDTVLPQAEPDPVPSPRRARGPFIGGTIALLILGGCGAGALALGSVHGPTATHAVPTPGAGTAPPATVTGSPADPGLLPTASPRPSAAPSPSPTQAAPRDASAPSVTAVDTAPVEQPAAPAGESTAVTMQPAPSPSTSSPSTSDGSVSEPNPSATSEPRPQNTRSAQRPTPSPGPTEPADEPASDDGLIGDALGSLFG